MKSDPRRRSRFRETVPAVAPRPNNTFFGALAFVLAYNALLGAWLFFHPVLPAPHKIVSNVAQAGGPLIMSVMVMAALWRRRAAARRSSGGKIAAGVVKNVFAAPLLLALGVLGYAAGQFTWARCFMSRFRCLPGPIWAT